MIYTILSNQNFTNDQYLKQLNYLVFIKNFIFMSMIIIFKIHFSKSKL